MTFKKLILPAAIIDYVPANYRECVFFTIHKECCVQYPLKWEKWFPNARSSCERSLFYMKAHEHPIDFLQKAMRFLKDA